MPGAPAGHLARPPLVTEAVTDHVEEEEEEEEGRERAAEKDGENAAKGIQGDKGRRR